MHKSSINWFLSSSIFLYLKLLFHTFMSIFWILFSIKKLFKILGLFVKFCYEFFTKIFFNFQRKRKPTISPSKYPVLRLNFTQHFAKALLDSVEARIIFGLRFFYFGEIYPLAWNFHPFPSFLFGFWENMVAPSKIIIEEKHKLKNTSIFLIFWVGTKVFFTHTKIKAWPLPFNSLHSARGGENPVSWSM